MFHKASRLSAVIFLVILFVTASLLTLKVDTTTSQSNQNDKIAIPDCIDIPSNYTDIECDNHSL